MPTNAQLVQLAKEAEKQLQLLDSGFINLNEVKQFLLTVIQVNDLPIRPKRSNKKAERKAEIESRVALVIKSA